MSCLIKIFPFIHILIRINTFHQQQNKFIDISISKLKCSWIAFLILRWQCLNNMYCKLCLYFTELSLIPSHWKKQSQSLHFIYHIKQTCHKSCIINKFCFVINLYNILISVFINFLNFFFYGIGKSFVLFCILHKIFILTFIIICELFYDKLIIIVSPIVNNYRNFNRDIKS